MFILLRLQSIWRVQMYMMVQYVIYSTQMTSFIRDCCEKMWAEAMFRKNVMTWEHNVKNLFTIQFLQFPPYFSLVVTYTHAILS